MCFLTGSPDSSSSSANYDPLLGLGIDICTLDPSAFNMDVHDTNTGGQELFQF